MQVFVTMVREVQLPLRLKSLKSHRLLEVNSCWRLNIIMCVDAILNGM